MLENYILLVYGEHFVRKPLQCVKSQLTKYNLEVYE